MWSHCTDGVLSTSQGLDALRALFESRRLMAPPHRRSCSAGTVSVMSRAQLQAGLFRQSQLTRTRLFGGQRALGFIPVSVANDPIGPAAAGTTTAASSGKSQRQKKGQSQRKNNASSAQNTISSSINSGNKRPPRGRPPSGCAWNAMAGEYQTIPSAAQSCFDTGVSLDLLLDGGYSDAVDENTIKEGIVYDTSSPSTWSSRGVSSWPWSPPAVPTQRCESR